MDLKEFFRQVKHGEIDIESDYYLYDEEYIIVDDHQNNDFCTIVVDNIEGNAYKFIGPYPVIQGNSKVWSNSPPDDALLFDLNFNKEN